ncbi:MAG: FAD-dependent oxidoreductase, partial [Rhodothermales bacterium]|nr:FAD-dependent oxidoreductase [Rhodothermales bacterium]
AWRHGIPQYTPGYDAVLRHLGALEAAHPGLYFAGNYRDGVSVPDAMASGEAAAQRLREALAGGGAG